MALFNKLFSTNKQQQRKNVQTTVPTANANERVQSHFPFTNDQVRVLMFRECDYRGRRLLFDSNAIQKENIPQSSNTGSIPAATTSLPGQNGVRATYIEKLNGNAYKYMATAAPTVNESSSIGSMIFGSGDMAYRGTSLKVHWLPQPTRILCSQIFLAPIHGSKFLSTNTLDTSSGTDLNSYDTSSLNSFSLSSSGCIKDHLNTIADDDKCQRNTNPLDVPPSSSGTSDGGRSFAYSAGDSGYNGVSTVNHDIWTTSCSSYCPHWSTRSSFGSISSDHTSSRKLSVDSSSIHMDDVSMAKSNRSSTSNGSLQRRVLRNLSTSFENSSGGHDFTGYIGDHQHVMVPGTAGGAGGSEGTLRPRRCSEQVESRSNPEMFRRRGPSGLIFPPGSISSSSTSGSRRPQLGVAICIQLNESTENEMKLFCSEHFALIESMLCRLRAIAETAYMNQKKFYHMMIHGWLSTISWLDDLFTAPRLPNPIWLTLSCGYSMNPNTLAQGFMNELCHLLNYADTKDTNFFVSTLLTAILTHHLGWVGTVAPLTNCSNGITNSTFDITSSTSPQTVAAVTSLEKTKMSEISKYHPYNALWAQMGDLYGAIGSPPKISKTVICGRDTSIVDKILNVLTYFIRCGEIRRNNYQNKIVNKTIIDEILDTLKENKQNGLVDEPKNGVVNQVTSKSNGFCRTATCIRNLNELITESEPADRIGGETSIKMNDIPNVLAFRDSHFVQQELRIGNKSMDTGIEMNFKQKLELQTYQLKKFVDPTIKLLVTSPENVEFNVDSTVCDVDEISIDAVQLLNEENSNEDVQKSCRTEKCKTEPDEKTGRSDESFELKRSKSMYTKSSNSKNLDHIRRTSKTRKISCSNIDFHHIDENDNVDGNPMKNHPSLSDLITDNSVGRNERLTWGIERVKEAISPEEEHHFELAKKRIEQNLDNRLQNSSVVFVLGDNEALVGLKAAQSQQLCEANLKKLINCNPTKEPIDKSSIDKSSLKTKKCSHKKHSGVKFNFEQYPQIATNYMKNKNIDLTAYDFMDKSNKLDTGDVFSYGPSSSTFPMTPTLEEEKEEQCECCRSLRMLQTPSNATELEFSVEDNNYFPPIQSTKNKPSTSSTTSVTCNRKSESICDNLNADKNKSLNDKNNLRNSLSNHLNGKGCAAKQLRIVSLPIPKTEQTQDKEPNPSNKNIRPGFIPSLFIGITDHYIADMVLQGITTTSLAWENVLKKNLALAAHCATLEQSATENVAIIANTDKWDIKVVSSQTYVLPCGSGTSGPIGMSQLVATMLETVHAMWLAGTNAYQCMSYMESKLQEMYLQSETLAAFLLATEFCSLNTVTAALNLSANDVPLLLSVASIHSPQVTKKYGVSFR